MLTLAASGAAEAGRIPLIDAIKSGDSALVRELLKQRTDVNTPEPDGATALHWAVHRNDLDTARLLIEAGARVNAANDLGIAPLWLACTNGSASLVKVLLQGGANVDLARPTGETPLMTCSRTGNVEAVKALLSAGANVHAKESASGQNPLMWAAARNHVEIVQMLLDAGADLRARTAKGGFTPLLFAVREGALDATRLLLGRGADVNDTAADGTAALLAATYTGRWDVARFLLEQGADPNADKAGYTALHWASGTWEGDWNGVRGLEQYQWVGGRASGKLDLVKALLARGANPNARIRKAPPRFGFTLSSRLDLEGSTPFLLAALGGQVEIMKVLLTAGANPQLTTVNGTTPLMAGAGFGRVLGESRVTYNESIDAIKVALEVGGDINHRNMSGESALHAAVYRGEDPVVQFLVDKGADINARNKMGSTPLVLAEGHTGPGACTITWPTIAALLRKLGGVNNLEFEASVAAPGVCPSGKMDVASPDLQSSEYQERVLFIKRSATTRYVGGSCADLKSGTRVRISGTRAVGQGWDGSVDATRIEIVQ